MSHKRHIRSVLKELCRTKPDKGQPLGEFLDVFVDKILIHVPQEKTPVRTEKRPAPAKDSLPAQD